MRKRTYALISVVVFVFVVLFGYFWFSPKTQAEWIVYVACVVVSAVLNVAGYMKAVEKT